MRHRRVAETSPPTLTSEEVAEVFLRAISPSNLQYLDEQQYLRPSFYFSSESSGRVVTREERDLLIKNRQRTRGDHHRRFTYEDLVWIRLLIYVKDGLKNAGVAWPLKKAGDIVRRLKVKAPEGCPPSARLIFFGQDVYLLEESTAVSLTDGQLVLTQVLTDSVQAEVRGRIEALIAMQRIRPIPTKCSMRQSDRMSA
jgi:hypothetical protein